MKMRYDVLAEELHTSENLAMIQTRKTRPANQLREAVLITNLLDLIDAMDGISTD